MKNTIKIIVLSFLMLFCIMSFSYASSISISSDKDLTNINPGEEFNVKVKLNSDEDSVAVQCKLEFDSNKLEIIKDEAYEEMAKVDIGEDVENVTADTEGNLIINTIKGKSENNVCEFTFKVKENAKLKNDKIVLKKVDSSIQLTEEENILTVGKQSKITIYHIIIIIGVVIILIILILIIKSKRKGDIKIK